MEGDKKFKEVGSGRRHTLSREEERRRSVITAKKKGGTQK